MKNLCKSLIISLISFQISIISAQEILIQETASLKQVYGEQTESETLLPMNDLNVEFGYVLYETTVNISLPNAVLELENVRDYAVVYLDDKLMGTLTDNRKKITLQAAPGKYTLQLYAENIGRITYGPEILDNSKGLFGELTVDGENVENWTITVLDVKDCDVSKLTFTAQATGKKPCFHKGYFTLDTPVDFYLNISGWGMGEAWINGQYLGSYWEEEKQQSIQVPASVLQKGQNEVVVFELKNNEQQTLELVKEPVFK